MLQHRPLVAALKVWSQTGRLGNMATERSLAQMRKAAPDRCCTERLLGASFLGQIQTKHLAAGGEDLRKLTRRQLLRLGAPLRAARGRSTAQKRAGRRSSGFAAFAGQQHMARRVAGERLSREAYRAMMRALSQEWQETPAAMRPVAGAEPPAGGGMTYKDRIGSGLWGCSDAASPLAEELVGRMVRELAPPSEGRTRGLTESLAECRSAFLASKLVKDEGPVPGAWVRFASGPSAFHIRNLLWPHPSARSAHARSFRMHLCALPFHLFVASSCAPSDVLCRLVSRMLKLALRPAPILHLSLSPFLLCLIAEQFLPLVFNGAVDVLLCLICLVCLSGLSPNSLSQALPPSSFLGFGFSLISSISPLF